MVDGAAGFFRESRRSRYGGGDRADRGYEFATFHVVSPHFLEQSFGLPRIKRR
jgi:hypothetical protein